MKRAFILCSLLMALVLAALPSGAQDAQSDEHVLLQMLSMIPDTPVAFEGIPLVSYIDYRALEQARPGVPTYENWNEWRASQDSKEDSGALWVVNSFRINNGPQLFRYLTMGNETPELVGFDLFDVDHALTFGAPPSAGNVLAGEFDAEAIERAFVARDYDASEQDDVLLLRRSDGREGTTTDLRNRNPANPLGGDLGRQEPVAVGDGFILNSPDDELWEAMVAAYQGEQRALLDRPSIAAAAEAITQQDMLLVQAAFLDPSDVVVASFDPAILLEMTPGAELDASMLTPQAVRNYGTLPLYTMSVLADLQDGEDQVALVALVYDSEDEARQAAEEMTTRLALFRNEHRDMPEPLMDTVEGARTDEPDVFFSEATGKYVALASVRYPMPDNAREKMETGEPGPFKLSGVLYRDWINALYARAFDVLAVIE
ncbi:MAG: hypothetical protein DIU68_014430 [Chloroflexota bacterium]|nr:MAG: hypothetical protein DIU68_05705 [Chloroflexota bacterium]